MILCTHLCLRQSLHIFCCVSKFAVTKAVKHEWMEMSVCMYILSHKHTSHMGKGKEHGTYSHERRLLSKLLAKRFSWVFDRYTLTINDRSRMLGSKG